MALHSGHFLSTLTNKTTIEKKTVVTFHYVCKQQQTEVLINLSALFHFGVT